MSVHCLLWCQYVYSSTSLLFILVPVYCLLYGASLFFTLGASLVYSLVWLPVYFYSMVPVYRLLYDAILVYSVVVASLLFTLVPVYSLLYGGSLVYSGCQSIIYIMVPVYKHYTTIIHH